jgi:hypothetical protein
VAPYKEKYPVGTKVRVDEVENLRAFKRDWKYHHPISGDQVRAAGVADKVKAVSFYHGGDVLYELEQTPGTWHEACLLPDGSR